MQHCTLTLHTHCSFVKSLELECNISFVVAGRPLIRIWCHKRATVQCDKNNRQGPIKQVTNTRARQCHMLHQTLNIIPWMWWKFDKWLCKVCLRLKTCKQLGTGHFHFFSLSLQAFNSSSFIFYKWGNRSNTDKIYI